MMKAVDEKNGEGVLRWFGYVGRMENNRISKRVHVGERVRQTRRMVHDRSEWRGFVRKNLAQMEQNAIGRYRAGEGLQVPSGP